MHVVVSDHILHWYVTIALLFSAAARFSCADPMKCRTLVRRYRDVSHAQYADPLMCRTLGMHVPVW